MSNSDTSADAVAAILQRADAAREQFGLDYAGALSPQDAHALQQAGAGVVVDVRTRPELAFVGRIPDALEVEWQQYPDMTVNTEFTRQLQSMMSPDDGAALFVCRSGARSHHAATAAAAAGYRAYNVLEGFEGDLNEQRHRNVANGWRARGLPWQQS